MPYRDLTKRQKYQKEWNRTYYLKNRKKEIARITRRKAELRAWLTDYRKTLMCERCGENHPACLDFHHENPGQKDFSIANIKGMGWGKKKVLLEIQKCVVLCANCHRKTHAKAVK